MSFILSNSFVQEIRKISPLKPIVVLATWYDDSNGTIADLSVIHHVPGQDYAIRVKVGRTDTNETIFKKIRNKMLYWRKVRK